MRSVSLVGLLILLLGVVRCGGQGMSIEERRQVLIARGGLRAACTYVDFTGLPQYKANLQCHTRHSDGGYYWDEVASWYEQHGYKILSMTDHDGLGDQDGGVDFPYLQNDQIVHDWDGDGVLHPDYRRASGVEAYIIDYDGEAPPWVPRSQHLDRPGEFVILNGMESSFGHHHTNVIEPPLGRIPRPREGYRFIDWCHSNNGIVFVAHPADWNDKPERILMHPELRKVDGLEVFNGNYARNNNSGQNTDGSPGLAEKLWDACLDGNKKMWGFADDDEHVLETDVYYGPGSAWNMVWARELTKESVMESLRRGAFYASCGIEVDRVELTAESITVHSTNATHIKVIADGGRTVGRVDGPEITYTIDGSERWIRVVLWNDTICYPDEVPQFPQKAWLQPIMLEELL